MTDEPADEPSTEPDLSGDEASEESGVEQRSSRGGPDRRSELHALRTGQLRHRAVRSSRGSRRAGARTSPAPRWRASTPRSPIRPSSTRPGASCGWELDVTNTPGTVNSFVNLARFGYYDDTLVHRSAPSIGILQGGSPHTNSAADPGPGYTLWDEGTGFTYRPGQLVMARRGEPNSAGAQYFFTVTPDAGLLDSQGTYVVFGEVLEGLGRTRRHPRQPRGHPGQSPRRRPLIRPSSSTASASKWADPAGALPASHPATSRQRGTHHPHQPGTSSPVVSRRQGSGASGAGAGRRGTPGRPAAGQ